MPRKRIGILTGGGDVPPLNAFIESARKKALTYNIELIGFLKGWQGVLEKIFIPLSQIIIDPLIGGTILKSSRVNISKVKNGLSKVRKNLEELKIEGLIVVGGEDTLSNCFFLLDFPQVLISKTIDNDVGIIRRNNDDKDEIVNHFTLGYPTAARKIASFVSLKEGLRTTAYSHERIIIVESMGMHAGWLALASSLGHPDFIIIPEFPLNYNVFKELIIEKFEKQRHLVIVVAEGAKFFNGDFISADKSETDSFGHPRFKGAAERLASLLKQDLKRYFNTRNINAVNPSYLYRSGSPCKLDIDAACLLASKAVEMIYNGIERSLFLTISLQENKIVVMPYYFNNMTEIYELHRFVNGFFYNTETFLPTDNGIDYLKTIAEEIPFINYGLSID